MTEFSSHAPGTPSWVDLMSPDVDKSEAFYTSVFGWDAKKQTDEEGNYVYTLFMKDDRSAAGMGSIPPGAGEMPSVWNTYIAVEDVAATAAAVESAGGTVLMPPMQVMTSGEMAVFIDPTGAAFSVWKAQDHIGVEIGNIPDTFSWNELMTRDIETAKTFYSTVFGWKYDAMDMGEGNVYHVIEGGEEGGLGGLMAMPAEVPEMVPNHWAVYFSVADLDASIQKVIDAGGQVVMPPMEIMVGTFATVHDNHGASFALMQPAES